MICCVCSRINHTFLAVSNTFKYHFPFTTSQPMTDDLHGGNEVAILATSNITTLNVMKVITDG